MVGMEAQKEGKRVTTWGGKEDKDDLPGVDKFTAVRPAPTPQIEKLQAQGEAYRKKIEVERRKVLDLDRTVETLNAKLNERRRKVGGTNAPAASADQVKKQIKILANRLEKALQKHNATMAANKKTRENIDNLRRERLVFDQLYKKLEKESAEKRKEMQHKIEVSNRAYEAREAAVTEMARLKTQSDREQQVFEAEFKELGRLIEHDRKMRDYTRMRSKENQEELEKERMPEEESKLGRKRALKGHATSMKMSTTVVSSTTNDEQGAVQTYAEAFSKIKQATGIEDYEELVTTFINAEDENYRLYKYIDELTQENARLEEQIADISKEIEQYHGADTVSSKARERELAELTEQIERTRERTSQYVTKQVAATELIEKLKVGIYNVFTMMGCDTPENMEIVGNNGVTVRNLSLFLSLLEERTTEILQMYTREMGLVTVSEQAEPTELPGTATLTIEPPSTTDKLASDSEEEEEEEEDRPLTRQELEMKTMKSLQKREVAMAARKRQMKAEQDRKNALGQNLNQ
mmetsp:Transcript_13220/g.28026  ORF Transcript_13220/g.28026 Transcript_13220/m.28026 type:complete len:522 (-) Transcript_13220:418-1983(-)|eukprot:CAMPEP_0118936104 /NCGR_PEP_ID=MMETSP1169-20130426/16013_1 /TAXON_ID=36882 /ORGANISM="Pyramimonas obovata, Strain CCMP722" /LENGTH=521 /DNA_ID=CAMNT_0006879217 /DNA_START=233 /DNA_END=1798 /DNA_ORIENTATION=+